MIKKKQKTLIIILITVLVLVLAFATLTVTTYSLHKAEKKAVIILPGLFASGLYNEETGEGVWDPFGDLDIHFSELMSMEGMQTGNIISLLGEDVVREEISKLRENDNYGAEDSLFNLMAMSEDGVPEDESVQPVPWDNENRVKYGVVNTQKDMYNTLEAEYGDDYNVEIFNYDFRLDNRLNSELLEEYIKQQGYKDVILVSHSNGGQVAAGYLARSQENRDLVSKHISYSAPYFGSFSALLILENVDVMISGVKDMLGPFAGNIEAIFEKQFKSLLNIWTAYQLLPNYELLKSEYNDEQSMIYVDGEPLPMESKEDLWAFYCSRPWARKSNGALKPAMRVWLDYTESIMVTKDNGERVLSTELIDTTYFSGMDVNTTNKVYFTTNESNNTLELTNEEFTPKGDGTVLLSSAAGGDTDSKDVHLGEGYNHYGVNICYDEYAKIPTIAAMNKSIEKNDKWYNGVWKKIM